MSTPFYDLASLVVVPSGYKASKVYAQKPLTTDGQLSFSRASTATRVNASGLIETVSSGVPRLDYLGSTCPKLLLQPQRTNVLTYSEQQDNAAWTKAGATITANATTSPDGTSSADKVVENTASGTTHGTYQSASVTNGVGYTWSGFFKAAERTAIQIYAQTSGSYIAKFNLSNGTVISVDSGATASVVNYGNGWYRCIITAPTTAGTAFFNWVMLDSSNEPVYTGNGTSGVFCWGIQLEEGAYATSYIPTTSAAVTRLADVSTKSSISALFGASATTFFLDFEKTTGAYGWTVTGGNGTKLFSVCQFDTNSERPRIVFDDGVDTSSTLSPLAAGRHKIAVSYAGNDTRVYIDGQLVFTDTACTYYQYDRLAFNATAWTGNTNNILLFKLNQFLMIPAASTNAQLAELTTL